MLAHLNKFGPSLYDALSVRFDTKHATDIQPILRGLKEYGYIEMDREKMVMITTFGLQQLQ